MERNLNILLIDDEPVRLGQWQRQLNNLPAMSEARINEWSDIPALLDLLGTRRQTARKELPGSYGGHVLDDTDVLIIDHDLGPLSSSGAEVAYLARCFTNCGIIVLLNSNGENVFDLHLHPDMDLFADLEIGSKQLSNPGIWGNQPVEFRPWGWQNLIDAVDRLKRRSEVVLDSLNNRFAESIGLDEGDTSLLPRATIDHLWKGSADRTKEFSELTFRQLAEPGMGIVRRKDILADHALARVLASRIGTWLEGFVLGGQEVLVDAPHLASRFPSLFESHIEQSGLDATISWGWKEATSFDSTVLAKALFSGHDWLSRPAWRWRKLRSNADIREIADPFSVADSSVVFCEDRSAFLPLGSAKSFKSDLGTPFDRRWIAGPIDNDEFAGNVTYLPADRLL